MTIGVIARLKIAPGQEQPFEALFAEQAEQVRANEPANRLYRLFRDRAEPGGYIVMEIYDDEAALEAHRAAHTCRRTGRGSRRCSAARRWWRSTTPPDAAGRPTKLAALPSSSRRRAAQGA